MPSASPSHLLVVVDVDVAVFLRCAGIEPKFGARKTCNRAIGDQGSGGGWRAHGWKEGGGGEHR